MPSRVHSDEIKHGMDPNYGLRPHELAEEEKKKKERAEKLKRLSTASPTFYLSPIPIKPKKLKEEKK